MVFALIALAMMALGALRAEAGFLSHKEDDLPGWMGETHTVRKEWVNPDVNPSNPSTRHDNPHIEILSWEPRIFLYHGFLSDEEADHMVEQSRPRMKRSGVVDTDTGGGTKSDVRTSSGTFIPRGANELMKGVERRLAEWSLIPAENGEDIQVLRYEIGQKYDPHFDYFFHKQGMDNGGNRIATVLMYLRTPEHGGETIFPNVPARPYQNGPEYTDCGRKGLAVKPVKGDAVLFFSLNSAGVLDKGSNHGSCPVVRGEKWAATKWIHVGKYALAGEKAVKIQHVKFAPPPAPAPPGCTDRNDACAGWSEAGECDANPGFMLGNKGQEGMCLLSCGRCDLMKSKSSSFLRGAKDETK